MTQLTSKPAEIAAHWQMGGASVTADLDPNPVFRSMEQSDVVSCVRLIRRAMNGAEARQAQETFRFHFLCRRYHIDDGRAYYILAESNSILGLVGLHRYVWGPPENVWLAWFAVDPDHQGQGLGTFLLDAITNQARRLGFTKFFVETYSAPEFAQARTFYQAHGFTKVGRIQAYLPTGDNMVVYGKPLIHPYEPILQGTSHPSDRGAGPPRHARA